MAVPRLTFAALAGCAVLWLGLSGGAGPGTRAQAQTAPAATSQTAGLPAAAGSIDYDTWEKDATEAEDILEKDRASTLALEQMRTRIVSWRTRFVDAQSSNQARIETLRNQITALGPSPADGATEAAEIASRRTELGGQLATLQAPGIAAVEAYSRADGIIRQIDTKIRERQAGALLKLSPSPINPINWPAGLAVLTQGMKTLGQETAESWANPARRTELRNNLPAILLYLVVAGVLMLRGAGFMERLTARMQASTSARVRHLAAGVVSLGQIVVPVGGMVLLVLATRASGMTGQRTGALIDALPVAAFAFFSARWLGSWLFPTTASEVAGAGVAVLADSRAEGRFHATMIGLMCAVEVFRRAFITEVRPPLSQAAQAVWAMPVAVLVTLFLFRLGMLLRRRNSPEGSSGEAQLFRTQMLRLTGTVVAGVSVLGPTLAIIGYVAAANAIIWPTVLTLGLIGLIVILQRFLTDIYLAMVGGSDDGREALIPMLMGMVLSVAALPFVALIWGARVADLSEVWTRFREGFAFGSTRISPTALLTLIVVFGVGYALTKLVQGALKSSVLPRTALDKGVQNALTAGTGYIGLFLAGLVAITAAGINLSSLAIVAGALSVGIGFGLQNIVQNFVSGIILLIERPISEGDWIEVGGQQGIVKAISVRSTRIETFDRIDVIVPNGDLIAGQVKNWTRFSPTGRIVVPVTLDFDADTRKVSQILLDVAQAQAQVMLQPEPAVNFAEFTPDGPKLELIAYVPDITQGGLVKTEIRHQIMERFKAEGIVTPSQQRDIWIRNPESVAEALRAEFPDGPGEKGPS